MPTTAPRVAVTSALVRFSGGKRAISIAISCAPGCNVIFGVGDRLAISTVVCEFRRAFIHSVRRVGITTVELPVFVAQDCTARVGALTPIVGEARTVITRVRLVIFLSSGDCAALNRVHWTFRTLFGVDRTLFRRRRVDRTLFRWRRVDGTLFRRRRVDGTLFRHRTCWCAHRLVVLNELIQFPVEQCPDYTNHNEHCQERDHRAH